MQRIDAEKLAEAWAKAVTDGAPGAFAALVTHDVEDISSAPPTPGATASAPPTPDATASAPRTLGAEPFEARTRALHAAFGDVHVTIDSLIVEDARLAWRFTLKGQHRGPFLGVEPTGRRVSIQGVNFQRIDGGRVGEHWTLVDRFELLRQLRGT